MADSAEEKEKNIFKLIADLPSQVRRLVIGEFNLLKAELLSKGKNAGIGIAFFVVALMAVGLMFLALFMAVIYVFAIFMPTWAAALLVAAVFLVIAAVFVVLGISSFKKFGTPMPNRTAESVQSDIDTITGKNS